MRLPWGNGGAVLSKSLSYDNIKADKIYTEAKEV